MARSGDDSTRALYRSSWLHVSGAHSGLPRHCRAVIVLSDFTGAAR